MKASAILAAIGVGVLATALAAQPTGLPQGWMQTGDAQTCEDKVVPATGAPSARVFNLDCKPNTKGFTSLMQMVAGTDYAGKRVRLSAQLRGNQLAEWGGLWMRADSGQKPTAFDNMFDRQLNGSFGWRPAEIVLDIPADATALSFGFLLTGAGQLQATDFRLEVVTNTVPTTGAGARALPRQPSNLTPS